MDPVFAIRVRNRKATEICASEITYFVNGDLKHYYNYSLKVWAVRNMEVGDNLQGVILKQIV